MKTYALDELTDKYIGEKESVERRQFEFELELDILGSSGAPSLIKRATFSSAITKYYINK